MAYALLSEGMSLEARAAFDQMINAAPDQADSPERSPESRVVRQNRDFLAGLAGMGVPVPVIP